MKKLLFVFMATMAMFLLQLNAQGDLRLTEAYKKAEAQFAALKIRTDPSVNYLLYTESLGSSAREAFITDNLKSGIFGSADKCFVILYKPSEELEKEVRSVVAESNIRIISSSKIFEIMKSALDATKDLYLIKFDFNKRVNIAAKLAG